MHRKINGRRPRRSSFAEPLFQVGRLLYYSVDHTPSLLWDSASWEISISLLPYLKDFLEERENPVLDAAVDMKDGVIVNRDILIFQHRDSAYPYRLDKCVPGKPVKRIGKIPRRILCHNAGLPHKE